MRRPVEPLRLLLALSLVACGEDSSTWEPRGRLDCRAELTVGSVGLLGRIDLRLQVYRAGGEKGDLKFTPSVPLSFVGEIESAVARRGEGWLHSFVLHLRPTQLGEIEIPPFEIEHGGETVTTELLQLDVVSVLRDADDPKAVEDPAAPFPPLTALWPYFVAAGAVVVLLVWWYSRRSPRAPVLPVEVPLPPWVKALRDLQHVEQAGRETEAEIEAFYVAVSQILRVYLEERFDLHAPMRSTEEFLIEVEQGDCLSSAHRHSLAEFLHQCDLVKFARLLPEARVHSETIRVAADFVEQTRADRVNGMQRDDRRVDGGAA